MPAGASASCSDSSLSTQSSCLQVDGPATATRSFASSEVLALSAEFLRVPSTVGDQVDVAVNGLAASCASETSGQCGYQYNADQTPTIVSVDQTSGQVGTVLTITGRNYPPEANDATATVSIGPAGGCDVASVSWGEYGVRHLRPLSVLFISYTPAAATLLAQV